MNDRWVQVDKVWPSDTFESQRFGHAAALDGDGAVITAWNSSNGQAYVFERDPNGKWIEKSKLMPVGSLGVSYYGRCAALHGNVAVVGAPSDDQFGFAAGAAHVFERDQSGAWKHVVKLVEPDTAPDAVFGSSVAVRGETIIVGALGAKYGSIPSAGAVYVYTRTGPGQWTKTAKLFAADPANSDGFGNAVSLSGDIAVIGALGDDEQAFQAGAVYVFHRQRGGWKQIAKLLAADGDAGDLLTDNNVLAVDGSFCIAGAINDQPYGEFSGSAYIFAVGPDVDGDGLMDACECPGDIDKDWTVDQGDLGILLADYGCTGKMPVPPNPGDCPGDLDADGDTDQSDLGILLANYAAICP